MRIEKTRSGSPVGGSRKSGEGADKAAFSSALSSTSTTSSAQAIAPSRGVSSVAALLALQGAEDPVEKRRRAERRGRQLLESLDMLKVDLLSERDPKASLLKMKGLMDSAREDSMDPALESIIDQIELRIAVELAKHKSVHES